MVLFITFEIKVFRIMFTFNHLAEAFVQKNGLVLLHWPFWHVTVRTSQVHLAIISFSSFGFSVLVLCMLAHHYTAMTYWHT